MRKALLRLVGLGIVVLVVVSVFLKKGVNRVAIVKIEGAIVNSEPILKELWKYEKSRSVRAIVLRINSPGGVVGASQEIYNEIKRIRGKKVVVASLGNIATSGAYYISSACDKIVAMRGTLTGSIGVLATFLSAEELVRLLKIEPFVVKSGKFKDTGSILRRPTEADRRYIKKLVMELFRQFKEDVVARRPLLKDKIDKIADGRVLLGEEALKWGLIDEIGTIKDAIRLAGELAGIKKPRVIWPKRKLRFLDFLLSSFWLPTFAYM